MISLQAIATATLNVTNLTRDGSYAYRLCVWVAMCPFHHCKGAFIGNLCALVEFNLFPSLHSLHSTTPYGCPTPCLNSTTVDLPTTVLQEHEARVAAFASGALHLGSKHIQCRFYNTFGPVRGRPAERQLDRASQETAKQHMGTRVTDQLVRRNHSNNPAVAARCVESQQRWRSLRALAEQELPRGRLHHQVWPAAVQHKPRAEHCLLLYHCSPQQPQWQRRQRGHLRTAVATAERQLPKVRDHTHPPAQPGHRTRSLLKIPPFLLAHLNLLTS